MEERILTYDDFCTDSYKKWVMGKNTPIDDKLSGYVTKDQKLVLFELDGFSLLPNWKAF